MNLPVLVLFFRQGAQVFIIVRLCKSNTSLCGFFLWGYLKKNVLKHFLDTLSEPEVISSPKKYHKTATILRQEIWHHDSIISLFSVLPRQRGKLRLEKNVLSGMGSLFYFWEIKWQTKGILEKCLFILTLVSKVWPLAFGTPCYLQVSVCMCVWERGSYR